MKQRVRNLILIGGAILLVGVILSATLQTPTPARLPASTSAYVRTSDIEFETADETATAAALTATVTVTPTATAMPTIWPVYSGIHVFDMTTVEEYAGPEYRCDLWVQMGIPEVFQSSGYAGTAPGFIDVSGQLVFCNLGASPTQVQVYGEARFTGWSYAGWTSISCASINCDTEISVTGTDQDVGSQKCLMGATKDFVQLEAEIDFLMPPFRLESGYGLNLYRVSSVAVSLKSDFCSTVYATVYMSVQSPYAPTATPTRTSYARPTNTPVPTITPTPGPGIETYPCNTPCIDWNLRSGCGLNDLWIAYRSGTTASLAGYTFAIEAPPGDRLCSRTLANDNLTANYKRVYNDEMLAPAGTQCGAWPEAGRAILYNASATPVAWLDYDSADHCGEILR